MDWQTTPPPIGMQIEFVTDGGKMLRGQVSFVSSDNIGGGKWVTQYMLRGGGRAVFHVVRWRHVGP